MTTETTNILPRETASIALTESGEVALRNIGEAFAFANLMCASDMIPKDTTPQAAAIAIIAGLPHKMHPFQAVQSFAVINGRPSLYGEGFKAVVHGSGKLVNEERIEYRAKDGSLAAVEIRAWRKGFKNPYIGRFSVAMAIKAGLWGKKGPWTQYPDIMLETRARAFAYRNGFADVLKGIQSAEEQQDIILAETTASVATAPQNGSTRRRASASEILAQAQVAGKAAGAAAGGGDASPAPSMPPHPENALAGTLGGENPPPAETDGTPPPASPAQSPESTPETTSDAIDADAEWLG